MENKFKIVEFDAVAAGEDLWSAFLGHADGMYREIEPEDPPLPRAATPPPR